MAIGFVAGEVRPVGCLVHHPFSKNCPHARRASALPRGRGHQPAPDPFAATTVAFAAFGELASRWASTRCPVHAFEYGLLISTSSPYEGVMFLYIFTTGCVTSSTSFHDDRPLHRRRAFIAVIAIPYWTFVGIVTPAWPAPPLLPLPDAFTHPPQGVAYPGLMAGYGNVFL